MLTPSYFQNLLDTYIKYPDAVGVGGYIVDEVKWGKTDSEEKQFEVFYFDGWKRNLGSRNVFRKKLNLLSDLPPGYMPEAGNGFSTGFLPPSGNIYPVEFLWGVASYKTCLLRR